MRMDPARKRESNPRTSHASRHRHRHRRRRRRRRRPPFHAETRDAGRRRFSRSASERAQATARLPPTRILVIAESRASVELCSKMMMGLGAAELSAAPDPLLVLRKRLRDEMEALRGILRKAELVAVDKGGAAPAPAPAPRRGKDGRFLAAEARSEAMEHGPTPRAKRRKAMPLVEIIEHPPQKSKADPIPCAKKMRTTAPPPPPPVEPRISKDDIFRLVTRLSSLSSNMPARIIEFLHKECTGHADEKAGEIEIDLGSMRRSAMLELQKLLDDEFAEGDKRRQQEEESKNVCRSTSRSSPRDRELEEGEFVEDEDCGATTNPCGGNACASPVAAGKGLCSLPRIHEDDDDEEVDICGDASPVEIEKFVEIEKSPISNSSSSSSSGSSSSDSGSSGSSSSDSSASNSSSDSDCDDDCVTSNLARADVPKTETCPMAMPQKVLVGPSPLLEDGEIEEEHESIGTSPVLADKFAETVNRAGSSNGQCVRSSPAPAVCPEPWKLQPAANCTARHFYAKGFEKKRERAAAAAQGRVHHFYDKSFERKRERDAAAEGTACYLYGNAFEKTRERQRAYEELEEMERKAKAKPIFDWIDPRHLRQLGITTSVSRRSCPLQIILGLFLKAE